MWGSLFTNEESFLATEMLYKRMFRMPWRKHVTNEEILSRVGIPIKLLLPFREMGH